MKRIVSFILIITLVLAVSGCSSTPYKAGKVIGSSTSVVPSKSAPVVSAGSTLPSSSVSPKSSDSASGASSGASQYGVKDDGLVASMQKLAATEYASLQLMYSKAQNSEEQNVVQSFNTCYGVYQATAYVLPIEVMSGGDMQSSIEENGVSDIKISQDGDTYTMDFTMQEAQYTLICQYDSATDSMTAAIKSAGKTIINFEYVAKGSGYVLQCFGDNGSGGYVVYKVFMDGSSLAEYGSDTATAAPQSIFKNTSLDSSFVESGSFYCKLNGSALSVTNNGTTATY